jgi:hypothetical protein
MLPRFGEKRCTPTSLQFAIFSVPPDETGDSFHSSQVQGNLTDLSVVPRLMIRRTLTPVPLQPMYSNKKKKKKQTPWPLVRERTIPTDRPPLVDEI